MFDETSNQFQQLASSTTLLPLHLPFPLHFSATHNMNSFPLFNPISNPSRHLSPQIPHSPLHPLHHHSSTHDDEQHKPDTTTASMTLAVDSQRPRPDFTQLIDDDSVWSNEEVLALLRVRSSMESWFSDFTWEHVSRKLLEIGFKRSAEKCKDKFELESRYFNANINCNKNYSKFASDLQELYQADQQNLECATAKTPLLPEKSSEGQDKMVQNLEAHSGKNVVGKQYEGIAADHQAVEKLKRKRSSSADHKFEMFQVFCEKIVNCVMSRQEEMHKKLIEDMVKRDKEKIAREEVWKKQEMEKMNKDLEIMAKEQGVAGDRQATIIEFLKKFAATSSDTSNDNDHAQVLNTANPNTAPTSSLMHLDNHISHTVQQNNHGAQKSSSTCSPCRQSVSTSCDENFQTIKHFSSTEKLRANNPIQPPCFTSRTSKELASSSAINPYLQTTGRDITLTTRYIPIRDHSKPTLTDEKDEYFGRRWPKDEVLALVNLRCSLYNQAGEDKEGDRAPLWERISQRMLELGYQRSSKRCKEKWENINKYFRKTKNVHNKRSLDSRTCPYFHPLSAMYNQGKVMISQSEMAVDNHLTNSPSDHLLDQLHSHHVICNITSNVDEVDNKNSIHAHPFDYEL